MFGAIMMILGMVLMKILQRCHMRWNRLREDPTMRSMRVTADGTTSSTRPTTRSVGERSGRSDTVQGRQDHGWHCDGSTSRSSLSSMRGNEIRSAEQYDSGTQGTQGARGDDRLERCCMMARRRRQASSSAADGDAAVEAAALADGEGHDEGEEQLGLEDGDQAEFQGPVGRPTSLGPPTTPLFLPEQLRDLHEVQSQAPHLYAKVPRESVWRPGGGAQDQVQPPQTEYHNGDSSAPWPRA